jgi:hypothetical protein
MASRLLVLAIALAACAPEIPSPADHQRAVDRADADRLAGAVATLPGVTAARVELARDLADPLAPLPAAGARVAAPPRAAVVVVADPRTDADAVAAASRALAVAAGVPAPRVAVAVARAPRATAELVRVGPFEVAAGSAAALRATLLALLAIIAAAAAQVALRHRRGNRPQ